VALGGALRRDPARRSWRQGALGIVAWVLTPLIGWALVLRLALALHDVFWRLH